MAFRNFFTIITIIVAIIFLPLIVNADEVPWTSVRYRAYTYTSVGDVTTIYDEDSQESFGPPLTINATASVSWPLINPQVGATANSTISDFDMQVNTSANACCEIGGYGNAIASFTGSYTADAPYFQFNYTYNGIIDEIIDSAWLSVIDMTSGTTLYDVELSSWSSDTILVSTPLGNNIEVSFGLEMDSILYAGQRTNTLSYSTAVVPEPISSTLFILGGATLGFRQFRKKFRK